MYQHSTNCRFRLLRLFLIYPLTIRVIGAPQMILQPVSSIFPCSPLPPGTWWTPDLSIPWYCLPTSSSVCLVFLPLSLPCKMILAVPLQFAFLYDGQVVCVWSNCLLDLGTDILIGNSHCMRCIVLCGSTSFPFLVFFGALQWGSMIHKHTGRWMWQGSAPVIFWN